MLSRLLVSALLLAALPGLTRNINGTVTQTPGGSAALTPPNVKMGLWEATITNSIATATIKARSCVTPQSYQDTMAHVPPGCTVSNKTQTATSLSGDISCTLPHGGTTTGHIDVETPDPTTVRSIIKLSVTANGQTVPMTMTTESHFISENCGDIAPGQSKIVP